MKTRKRIAIVILAVATAGAAWLAHQPETESRRGVGHVRLRPWRRVQQGYLYRTEYYNPAPVARPQRVARTNRRAYYAPVSATAPRPRRLNPQITPSEQAAKDLALLPKRRTPGQMTREEVAKFKMAGMDRQSMMTTYGLSAQVDGNQEIWEVAGTSDGIRAPGRFVVTYGNDGKVRGAYTFGY